jgi:hypothetical protein
MASIKKRPDGVWRARYRDESGKEHARHFARKVDAQRWLDEVTASMLTGQYVDPRAGRVTFRAAEDWREAAPHGPSMRTRSSERSGCTSTRSSRTGASAASGLPRCRRE